MKTQVNPAPLSASDVAGMLDAACRSANPAAKLGEVAAAMAGTPAFKRRSEEIRHAAARLEINPWDADAMRTVEVRTQELRAAARIYGGPEDMTNSPLTVQPQLIFPLAPDHRAGEPMQRDRSQLTGRDPRYPR